MVVGASEGVRVLGAEELTKPARGRHTEAVAAARSAQYLTVPAGLAV